MGERQIGKQGAEFALSPGRCQPSLIQDLNSISAKLDVYKMISLCWYKVCIVWHYRVPVTIANQIGILPSLEVLPFFWDGFKELGDVHFAARSSYGRIMREMLGGSLAGGILPWEIFVSDIFARPNQRNRWVVPLFVQAYPTELVLKESISRAIHQAKRGSPIKLPAQLVIGVESMNSLTKRQFYDWLGQFKFSSPPKVSFRFLTIELMLQAMMEDALDGFITAAPWGKIAMEEKLGILDHQFVPGKFAQRLVMVHRKEMQSPCVLDQVGNLLVDARIWLSKKGSLLAATERMTASGKPHLRSLSLENTANQYRLDPAARDIISDTATITRELQHLHVCEALPPQVAATEETANLLLLR